MDTGTNRLSEVITFCSPSERIENLMKEQELKEHFIWQATRHRAKYNVVSAILPFAAVHKRGILNARFEMLMKTLYILWIRTRSTRNNISTDKFNWSLARSPLVTQAQTQAQAQTQKYQNLLFFLWRQMLKTISEVHRKHLKVLVMNCYLCLHNFLNSGRNLFFSSFDRKLYLRWCHISDNCSYLLENVKRTVIY